MQTVEGYAVDAGVLALLGAGESAVFAARPDYVTARAGQHWNSATVLLTDRRLVIAKDRLLGKPKADLSVDWPEVVEVNGSLWMGGGPKIQITIVLKQREAVELIAQPQFAVEIESAVRSAYLAEAG